MVKIQEEIGFKLDNVPEFEEMLDFYDFLKGKKFMGEITFRDFLFLSLTIWYGRRLAEITGLTIDDVKFNEGDYGKIYFKQLKKRPKKDIIIKKPYPIIKHVRKYLKEYIETYIKPLGEKKLFILTDRQFRNICYKYTSEFYKLEKGIEKKLSPHKLRHSIGTYLTHVRGPAYAKYWLGHSSIATTNLYLHTGYRYIEDNLPREFR